MNCAKCNRPLPIVKRRLYPENEWVDCYWTENGAHWVEYTKPLDAVCGYPGCTVQAPSELRKALRDLLAVAGDYRHAKPAIEAARVALAGDER